VINRAGSVDQKPLYGCRNCYEDYSWPSVDLAVYEGECWCENCWDERRWEGGDLPYFSDLDDFVPEHEKQLQAERERVRVLRDGMREIMNLPETFPDLDGYDWFDDAQLIAKNALQATAPGAGGGE
jgi:hypothetical protein